MLREIQNVKQNEKNVFRRWFNDSYFDLIIWFEGSKKEIINGFQLCYDKEGYERALTWNKDKGFLHTAIDSGEAMQNNRTPILIADGVLDKKGIIQRFKEDSQEIEPKLRNFILKILNNY